MRLDVGFHLPPEICRHFAKLGLFVLVVGSVNVEIRLFLSVELMRSGLHGLRVRQSSCASLDGLLADMFHVDVLEVQILGGRMYFTRHQTFTVECLLAR